MSYALNWLSIVLRQAGLKVAESPGWIARGHGDVGTVKGVLCHHTAGAKAGNSPSLSLVINGRSDLAGPLANLFLARDGTFTIVAAGKAYHAGAGNWQGVTDGNGQMVGIEAENTGLDNDEPWPAVQMDAYARGVAAILKHLGAPVIMCAGHKEYALPKGRKPDPSFDMVAFRETVAALMNVAAPTPAPAKPAAPDDDEPDPVVEALQHALVAVERDPGPVDGRWGPKTKAALEAQIGRKL